MESCRNSTHRMTKKICGVLKGLEDLVSCTALSSSTSSQPAITCSKLTIETLELGVKYVQS